MSTINTNYVPQSFINQQTGELKVDRTLAEAVQTGVQAKLAELPDVGDKAFLAAIANLAPSDVDSSDKLTDKLNTFAQAAKKLSEGFESLPFTGDISKFLARAMIEFAGQQRQQAVDDRMLARGQAQAELLNQAAKQEKAGQEMMNGAIINAVVSSVGAGLSFAGSLGSLKGQVSSIKEMKAATNQASAASKTMDSLTARTDDVAKGTNGVKTVTFGATTIIPPKPDAKTGVLTGNVPLPTPSPTVANKSGVAADGDAATAKLNAADANAYRAAETTKGSADKAFAMAEKNSMAYQTGGQAADAIGGMFKTVGSTSDSGMQATAKKTEAEGSVDAAQAEYLKQVADGKKEIVDTLTETMKQVINFIKEIQDAEVEAMRAITRG